MRHISETIKVLIVCNVIFFLGTLVSGEVIYRLFSLYYFDNPNFFLWQPVSHMFMHGGWMHLLFNMYALWAFGSPLEAQWGRNKFLFFYFSAGLGAALIHSLVNLYQVSSGIDALMALGMSESEVWTLLNDTLEPGSYRVIPELGSQAQTLFTAYNTPAVGASGAIYGVLVAFGLLYPHVELMLIFVPFPIKAKYFIPILIGLDLFSGLTGASLFGQNIANWAHIGGALFGFVMAYYWKKNSFNNKRWD
jgi:membrane associated rhomboid family serine protease